MAEHLLAHGWFLLRIDAVAHQEHAASLLAYLDHIPEKLHRWDRRSDLSAGNFGALNFASSFHAEPACIIDQHLTEAFRPILSQLARLTGNTHFQCVPDRLCVRSKKQASESKHRDHSGGLDPTDVMLGVIYNLNTQLTQHFTCYPGTHSTTALANGQAFTRAQAEAEEQEPTTLEIPPGCALIFFENILHRVTGGRPPAPLLRKFAGFLLNRGAQWCPENIERIRDQRPLIFKGGKEAPLYPRLWKTNWPELATAYAATLLPALCTDVVYRTGKHAGRRFVFPVQHSPGLIELGIPLAISDAARARFRPVPIVRARTTRIAHRSAH